MQVAFAASPAPAPFALPASALSDKLGSTVCGASVVVGILMNRTSTNERVSQAMNEVNVKGGRGYLRKGVLRVVVVAVCDRYVGGGWEWRPFVF